MADLRAPFVKLFHLGTELTISVVDFQYTYEEEKDDEAEIKVQFRDPSLLDTGAFQEGARLEVEWGLIGDSKYSKRIVYIRDIDIDFNDDGIKIALKATDKAGQLKNINNQDIPTQANLVELHQAIGKKFGLNTPTKSGDPTYSNLLGNDDDSFNLELTGDDVQANRNYFNFLTSLCKRVKNGPAIVEGRDDDLRIFKRNLNQRPIKEFTWGGDEGLISFKVSIKNKAKQGDATNIRVDSWDGETKSLKRSNVNVGDDDETQLGEVVDGSPRWIGSGSTADSSGVISSAVTINKYNLDYGQDPLNLDPRVAAQFKANDVMPGYFDRGAYIVPRDDTAAPIKSIIFPTDASKFNFSSELDHDGAIDEATNANREANLEKNKAEATFNGDVDLVTGRILTIKGVSKKYSGNFYITSAAHKIRSKQGYLVDLKMRRNALNRNGLENDAKLNINDAGLEANKKTAGKEYLDKIVIPDEEIQALPRKELKFEQAVIDDPKVKLQTEIIEPQYVIIDNEAQLKP